MKEFAAAEMNRSPADIFEAATVAPVAITNHSLHLNKLLSKLAGSLFIIGITGNTWAGCGMPPPDSNKTFPTILNLSQQVRITVINKITSSRPIGVEMPGREKFFLSAPSDDGGNADAIAALSGTRFAALGRRTSYLGKVIVSDGKPVDVVLKELPYRYRSYCGFWDHRFDACYIRPAKISPALGAIVIRGYKGLFGSDETYLYSDDESGSLLQTKNGTPVNYVREDAQGNVIVSVKSGGMFILKDGVLKEC